MYTLPRDPHFEQNSVISKIIFFVLHVNTHAQQCNG